MASTTQTFTGHGHSHSTGHEHDENEFKNGVGGSCSTPVNIKRIPLECALCPKNSKFSDLSHLLTHMGSKGHLSHQFKAGLVRNNNEKARKALEKYEKWFKDYGIEELLRTRSENREQKQQRSARSTPGSSYARRGASIRGRSNLPASTPRKQKNGTHSRLRLDQQPLGYADGIKYEFDAGMNLHSRNDFINHIRNGPPNHLWAPIPPISTVHQPQNGYGQEGGAYQNRQGLLGNNFNDYEEQEKSSQFVPSDDEEESSGGHVVSSPFLESSGGAELSGEEAHNAKYRRDDWFEGQDVFDAAPVDQRRRRNQRKGPDVIKHMEEQSLTMSPTVHVMTSDLVEIRQRNIYDPPSDIGSDYEEDEFTPRGKYTPSSSRVTRAQAKASGGKTLSGKTFGPPREFGGGFTASPAPRRGRGGRRRGRVSISNGDASGGRLTRAQRARNSLLSLSAGQSAGLSSIPAPNSSATPYFTLRQSHAMGPGPDQGGQDSAPAQHDAASMIFAPNPAARPHGYNSQAAFDVFADETEPTPGRFAGTLHGRRRPNALNALSLRPGNPNMPIGVAVSPTLVLKRPTPSRPFGGKENDMPPFHSHAQSNVPVPYLSAHNAGGANSFNPLCMQPRDNPNFRHLYPAHTEAPKQLPTSFHPVHEQHGFPPTFHMNEGENGPHESSERYNAGSRFF